MSVDTKRVLHVEDDPDLKAYVSVIIGNIVDINCTPSLKEAYDALAKENYDLILLDLNLPDGSGVDLLNKLSETGSQGCDDQEGCRAEKARGEEACGQETRREETCGEESGQGVTDDGP